MTKNFPSRNQKFKFSINYRYSKINVSTDIPNTEPMIREILNSCYVSLEKVITLYPEWKKSFDPIISGIKDPLILRMEEAAKHANVGPMAAIAGAIADLIAEFLIKKGAKHVVVEDGGEIAIQTGFDTEIALLSITSTIRDKLGFHIRGDNQYLGIASSSGTFGHSISLGEADLVTIIAKNAAFADAAATAIANEAIGTTDDEAIQRSIHIFKELDSKAFYGVLINKNEKCGIFGKIPTIVKIKNSES